jgi:Carboxypeptidase regulatory-like domain/TonB dependent receptor-like, beta-barrel
MSAQVEAMCKLEPALDGEDRPEAYRRAVLVVWFLACFALHASTGAGQTVGAMTGAINGTVADSTRAVLPGVTILISSAALMGTRTTVTNGEGLYRFPALAPGEYTLVFTLNGFKVVRREGIYVGLGFTATVDVELQISTLQENVIVERNSPVIDKQSTAIAATFDARQLADLPSARSMWAIQAATPAVYVARFDLGASATGLGGPISAYGTAGFNRPMVEGISVTGINPTGFTLNYGAFEEVSVSTAAHGPEWHSPGVHMQFLSKSGGNQYRGTLYADFGNGDWQSFNINEGQIRRGAQGAPGLSPRDANRLWSYHDINADVGGYVKPDKVWWYFSVREQEVSARQVNFPGRPLRTSLTNYSGKVTHQITAHNKLVAFGQAGRNYQPNRLDPFGPSGSGVGPATAINESEESTTEQLAWGWVWKGEWNSVINDTLFLEARVGQFGANRPQKPNGTAPRFEDVGNLIVTGGNRDWQENFRRNQVLGSLSYFKDGWSGSHQFKVGGEIFRTTATEIWKRAYPGDVLHVLRNGTPIEVYLFETPSRSESGLWTYSTYANDSWRASKRLTLNLGLRFDRYRVFLPEQAHPAGRFNPTLQTFPAIDTLIDWNVLAPRIGVTHDLWGDGKTIAKLSYGQYWLGPGTDLGFNANPNSNQWWRRHKWTDLDGSGIWEPGEEDRRVEESRGGIALESLDPGLELPVLREIAAWLERELFANTAVRTGLVWRGERQHYMRQNVNRPFDAFTVPVSISDPGPDGRVGTADDGPAIPGYNLRPEFSDLAPSNIVRNVPDADSHYWTWEITATRRLTGRWSMVAGFAHTWSRDQASGYFGQSVRNNVYPLTPNDLINAGKDGRYEFRIWSAKIHGTYVGPWEVRITPLLRHQSGQPFGRTFSTALNYASNVRILAEPIGTRRMNNVTLLDVRVEKGFKLGGHRRLAGFVDVFNVLNANPEQNTSWSSGPSFLRPLSIVPPRLARLGVKLDW